MLTETIPTEANAAPATNATPAPAGDATPQKTEQPVKTTGVQDPAKPAVDAAKAEPTPKAGAPEKYAEFTAPKGQRYDGEVIAAYSEAAKGLGLTQESAQQVLDKVAPVIAQRQAAQVTALGDEWARASQTDKEFGGDKFAENLGVAQKALTKFATPELIALLKESRLANHPDMIRAWLRVGRQISSDTVISGKTDANVVPSEEESLRKLYPSHAR